MDSVKGRLVLSILGCGMLLPGVQFVLNASLGRRSNRVHGCSHLWVALRRGVAMDLNGQRLFNGNPAQVVVAWQNAANAGSVLDDVSAGHSLDPQVLASAGKSGSRGQGVAGSNPVSPTMSARPKTAFDLRKCRSQILR